MWDKNSTPTSLLADLSFRHAAQVEVKLYKEHSFGLDSVDDADLPVEKPWVVALDKTGGRPLLSCRGQFKDVTQHMLQVTWEELTSELNTRFESEEWFTGIRVALMGELEYDGVFYFSKVQRL